MNATSQPICIVEGMRVGLEGRDIDIVDEFDLTCEKGQIVGLVGESGSGKTTSGTALLGYARTGAAITDGLISVAGHDIRSMSVEEIRKIRGVDIAYIPQDPNSALNPALRVKAQLRELLDLHSIGATEERDPRIREILKDVGLPNDDDFLRRYPHEMSGGQVQRVALAMAFLPRPKVLVLDEPTTGLDVTTQRLVLDTLKELCQRFEVAAIYVTHDLAVVASVADRVAVLYAGKLMEVGPVDQVFDDPNHPYTRALLHAMPRLHSPVALSGIPGRTPAPGSRPSGCRFHDRCHEMEPACATVEPHLSLVAPGHHVRCLRSEELQTWDPDSRVVADTDPTREREVILTVDNLEVFYGKRRVVHYVDFELAKREIVALVGESGSGKTTISRCIGGLLDDWEGSVEWREAKLPRHGRSRTAEQRKSIRYVFQNPYQSLNPRHTVEQILVRPLELFDIAHGKSAKLLAAELLDAVQLGKGLLSLRPDRLSGGERQRVALARALAGEPEILICDEITSALDVSVQGAIIELLNRIKADRGISMLFVTHDLALVRSIADRVLVLHDGQVVEKGLTAEVLDRPKQEYTRRLLAHAPEVKRFSLS